MDHPHPDPYDEPVSPEMSSQDEAHLICGPVTPWIPNQTEIENERAATMSNPNTAGPEFFHRNPAQHRIINASRYRMGQNARPPMGPPMVQNNFPPFSGHRPGQVMAQPVRAQIVNAVRAPYVQVPQNQQNVNPPTISHQDWTDSTQNQALFQTQPTQQNIMQPQPQQHQYQFPQMYTQQQLQQQLQLQHIHQINSQQMNSNPVLKQQQYLRQHQPQFRPQQQLAPQLLQQQHAQFRNQQHLGPRHLQLQQLPIQQQQQQLLQQHLSQQQQQQQQLQQQQQKQQQQQQQQQEQQQQQQQKQQQQLQQQQPPLQQTYQQNSSIVSTVGNRGGLTNMGAYNTQSAISPARPGIPQPHFQPQQPQIVQPELNMIQTQIQMIYNRPRLNQTQPQQMPNLKPQVRPAHPPRMLGPPLIAYTSHTFPNPDGPSRLQPEVMPEQVTRIERSATLDEPVQHFNSRSLLGKALEFPQQEPTTAHGQSNIPSPIQSTPVIRRASSDSRKSAVSSPTTTDSAPSQIPANIENDMAETYETADASVSLHTPQLSPIANTSLTEAFQSPNADDVSLSDKNVQDILDSVEEKVSETVMPLSKEDLNSLSQNLSALFASFPEAEPEPVPDPGPETELDLEMLPSPDPVSSQEVICLSDDEGDHAKVDSVSVTIFADNCLESEQKLLKKEVAVTVDVVDSGTDSDTDIQILSPDQEKHKKEVSPIDIDLSEMDYSQHDLYIDEAKLGGEPAVSQLGNSGHNTDPTCFDTESVNDTTEMQDAAVSLPESSINSETPECEKSAPESKKDSVCSDYSNPEQSQKPKLAEPNFSKGKSCDKPLTKNRTVPEEPTQQQREQRQPTPVVSSPQHTKEMKKKCQPQFQAQQPPLPPPLPSTSQKSILPRQNLKKTPPLLNQQPQQPPIPSLLQQIILQPLPPPPPPQQINHSQQQRQQRQLHLARRYSQEVLSTDQVFSFQKVNESTYTLKQHGLLEIPLLGAKLQLCVLIKDTNLREFLFYKHGLDGSNPNLPPWDNLPFGGTVKAVDRDTSSGFEFPRTYYFDNLSGSPKIIVNAKKVDFLTNSNHLANWISFAEFLSLFDSWEESLKRDCSPIWNYKSFNQNDQNQKSQNDYFNKELMVPYITGIKKIYKFQKQFSINFLWTECLPDYMVLVLDKIVIFVSQKESVLQNLYTLIPFGQELNAKYISSPKSLFKFSFPTDANLVTMIRIQILEDFSDLRQKLRTRQMFAVVRGEKFKLLTPILPEFVTTEMRDNSGTFQMTRTVVAISKVEIGFGSKKREVFLVYLDQYGDEESYEEILKKNSDQEMEGRAIDMLVLSKGNSSSQEYVDKFLQHDMNKNLQSKHQATVLLHNRGDHLWHVQVGLKWIHATPLVPASKRTLEIAARQIKSEILQDSAIHFSSHQVFAKMFSDKFKLFSWTQLNQNSTYSKQPHSSPAVGATTTPVNSCPSPGPTDLRYLCRKLNPKLPIENCVRFSAGHQNTVNPLLSRPPTATLVIGNAEEKPATYSGEGNLHTEQGSESPAARLAQGNESQNPIDNKRPTITSQTSLEDMAQMFLSVGSNKSSDDVKSPAKILQNPKSRITQKTKGSTPTKNALLSQSSLESPNSSSTKTTGLSIDESSKAGSSPESARLPAKPPIKSILKKTFAQPSTILNQINESSNLPASPIQAHVESSSLTEPKEPNSSAEIAQTEIGVCKKVWQPSRETRSMTENKNRRVISLTLDCSTEGEKEEEENSEIEDFGQHFSGGITKDHETENVDIVYKNRETSLEITILPGVESATADLSASPKSCDLSLQDKTTEASSEVAANPNPLTGTISFGLYAAEPDECMGEDDVELLETEQVVEEIEKDITTGTSDVGWSTAQQEDQLCLIKSVDSISVDLFHQQIGDQPYVQQEEITPSRKEVKSSQNEAEGTKVDPTDAFFRSGTLKPRGILAFTRALERSSETCTVSIADSERHLADEAVKKMGGLTVSNFLCKSYGGYCTNIPTSGSATELDNLSDYEFYSDDEKDVPFKEELFLCNVCEYRANTQNELTFHQVVGYHVPRPAKPSEVEQHHSNAEEDFSKFLTLRRFKTVGPDKPLIHQIMGWDFPPIAESPSSDVIQCSANDVTQKTAVKSLSAGLLEMNPGERAMTETTRVSDPSPTSIEIEPDSSDAEFVCNQCCPPQIFSEDQIIPHMNLTNHTDFDLHL